MMIATTEGEMISMRGRTMGGIIRRDTLASSLSKVDADLEETVTLSMRKQEMKGEIEIEYLSRGKEMIAMIGREMKGGMIMSSPMRKKKRKEMITLNWRSKFNKFIRTLQR
jgi:hypothetical protein